MRFKMKYVSIIISMFLFFFSFKTFVIEENSLMSMGNVDYISSFSVKINPSELYSDGEMINKEMIIQIKDLPGVKNLDFITMPDYNAFFPVVEGALDITGVSLPDFLFLLNGSIELGQGRTFSSYEMNYFNAKEVPVIIPSELSEQFNLDIDSNIEIETDLFGNQYQLKVIGIYNTINDENINNNEAEPFNSSSIILPNIFIKNAIFIPALDQYDPLNELEKKQFEHDILLSTSVFILDSQVDLNTFTEKANKILGDSFEISIYSFLKNETDKK